MYTSGTPIYSNTDGLVLFEGNKLNEPLAEINDDNQREPMRINTWGKGALLGNATGKTIEANGVKFVEVSITYDHAYRVSPSWYWINIFTTFRSHTVILFAREPDISIVSISDAKNADKAKKDADFQKQLADAKGGDKNLTGSGNGDKPKSYVMYVVVAVVLIVAGLVGFTLYRRSKAKVAPAVAAATPAAPSLGRLRPQKRRKSQ